MDKTFYTIWSFLLICSFLLITTSFSHAQQTIPNAGFETWEDLFLYEQFPPYNTTNVLALALTGAPNVTSATGCDGTGTAMRLETIVQGTDTLPGLATTSSLFGFGFEPSLPFSGEPDSVAMCLRWNMMPGDTAGVIVTFFTGGLPASNPIFLGLGGQQETWNRLAFGTGLFLSTPDSISVLFSTSITVAQSGSWMEVDDIEFIGSNSDTIPNQDFEQVNDVDFDEPEGWFTNNFFTALFGANPSVSRSMDSFSGNFAIQIETTEIEDIEDTVGFAVLAVQDSFLDEPAFGIPYTEASSPSQLSGYYKYTPVSTDTALVYALFTKWNTTTNQPDTVEEAILPLTAAGSYTEFTLPLAPTDVPDTFFIALASSNFSDDLTETLGEDVFPGSVLLVDDLTFDGAATSIDRDQWALERNLQVFPNPASDFVRVEWDVQPSESFRLRLINLVGQEVVASQSIQSAGNQTLSHQWPVEQLPGGTYYLVMTLEDGTPVALEKVIIR
ncbi:T9SS type A sorting domain-containing protein [Pontibacter sp. G13]|uniref:T9SS type A sorting domain-containing protein n=1 Tax=Pontibacter sp. G13 TaxID=3074898 RepID=UPI00288A2DC0|nr:T9SS type A sorting domain-containing protein [Pontibacter sp. G13]WNJ17512.1 T9SS type A sorting domain-containing protein [Pontibacter sp. G13]